MNLGCTFILKCTRSCNFKCIYCEDKRERSPIIDFEIVVKLLKEAFDLFQDIDFVFHGGEPLLLSRDYFSKVFFLQKLKISKNQRVRNSVQTNGSLINGDWCNFFRDNGVHVGVSLDGPQMIQDTYRRYRNGNSTFLDVVKGISQLAQNKVGNFGILSVVTRELCESNIIELFKFFVKQLRIENLCPPDYREISFLAERPPSKYFKDAEEAQMFYRSRREYADFLCKIYRYWIESDIPMIRIRELSSKMDSLVGGRTYVCTEAGPCVGKYIGIDPSGDVAHCDTFFDTPQFVFGNLKKESLSDILRSEKYFQAIEYEIELRKQCKECNWFVHCKGGCLYEALLFQNSGFDNRPLHCHSKVIYDFISKELQMLTDAL